MDERSPSEALIIAKWPTAGPIEDSLIQGFRIAREVISGVRTIRKEKNIPMKESLELYFIDAEQVGHAWDPVISKLTNISEIRKIDQKVDGALSFRVKSNEYFIPITGHVDVTAEIQKIQEELNYTRGFLASVEKKLANERFVNNAPEQVVALEQKKAADAKAKIQTLEKSLAGLE